MSMYKLLLCKTIACGLQARERPEHSLWAVRFDNGEDWLAILQFHSQWFEELAVSEAASNRDSRLRHQIGSDAAWMGHQLTAAPRLVQTGPGSLRPCLLTSGV